MPLFPRTDPDRRALIAYVVARALGIGVTPNRTRLVKLLYLVDIERVRSRREPLTGLRWVFFHYGPYAYELIDELDAMEGTQLVADKWNQNVLYRAAPGAPDGDDWPSPTKLTVDRVIDRFAPLELNDLLSYVYFHTGPMIDAERGQPLDLSLARNDPRPGARPRPLAPPPAPADVDAKLSAWRSGLARRLAPVALDPPGETFDDPVDALAGDGVRARLRVPERTEL
jgi:hypothetical protein